MRIIAATAAAFFLLSASANAAPACAPEDSAELCALAAATLSDNPPFAQLRSESQADAAARAQRHAERRARTRELLDALPAPNWRDLYRAGYITGYGDTRDERLLAMAIAIRALSLAPDEPDVRFLVAMTVDSVTRTYAGAQLYGRQKYFQFNPDTGATEIACLPQMLDLPPTVGAAFHHVEGYPHCPVGVGEAH